MIRQTGFNVVMAVLFVIGSIIGLYFQFSYHKFLNVDTLSYINIAERYAAGDWEHAVNGCWSPLYSWILAICSLASVPLLPACYILNFIAAGCCFALSLKIAGRYIKHSLLLFFFGFYVLQFFVYYGMSTLTPDLISTAAALWFILLISDKQYTSSNKIAIWAALAGAIMYFAKLYNFVLLHLFFIVLIGWLAIKNKTIVNPLIKQLGKTWFIFIGVSLIWITILSIHEHKLTFSTTGRFTHNIMHPDYSGTYPTYLKLYAPPFEEAYSIFIDPVQLLNEYDWSPIQSSRFFNYQLKLVYGAFLYYVYLLDNHRVKFLLLLVMLVLLFVNRKKITLAKQPGLNLIFLFFLLYPLFYFPIFLVDRYVLVCILLFHLFLFYLAGIISQIASKKIIVAAATIVMVSSLIPVFINGRKKLMSGSGEYAYYKSFYNKLSDVGFLRNQRIAADAASSVESIQLCYHLNCRYYCTWTDKQYNSLKAFNIRYLISKKDQASFPFLHLKEKMPGEKETIYIYEVQ